MIKRIVAIVFSVILLTGCTNRTTEKEITFWTLQMGDFAPYVNEIIQSYESTRPNTKIKLDLAHNTEKKSISFTMADAEVEGKTILLTLSAIRGLKSALLSMTAKVCQDDY